MLPTRSIAEGGRRPHCSFHSWGLQSFIVIVQITSRLHISRHISRSPTADPSSYRPISNFSVLSKLLERQVVWRLLEHPDCSLLFTPTCPPWCYCTSVQHSHGRSSYSAPETGTDIWSRWHGTKLVQQLLGRKTTSTSWLADFSFVHGSLHCTTGISPQTNSFSVVDWRLRSTGAPVCWWYSANMGCRVHQVPQQPLLVTLDLISKVSETSPSI